jgi:hypothetical protein
MRLFYSSEHINLHIRNIFSCKLISTYIFYVQFYLYHVLLVLFVFVCLWWFRAHVVLCFRVVFLHLVCPMLTVSLDCSFLITPSVFPNVYLQRQSLA